MDTGSLASLHARFSRLSQRQLLVVLFAGAFLVRLIYLLQIKDTSFFSVLVGDSAHYDAWAEQIRADPFGQDVFYQAPLYPYFLAGIYAIWDHSLLAARLVQMTLGATACVLLAAAGARLFGRGVGLLAGALLAVYAPAIYFDGLIQKASLDLFLVTALVWCLCRVVDDRRRRWALLAGVALGCLGLTRENALILLPLLGLWLVISSRRRSAIFFVLGCTLALAPVALRNRIVGGEVIVTSYQAGANFYIGNNADADGRYAPLRWGHGNIVDERADAIAIAEAGAGRHLSAGEVSRYWAARAWSWISTHPLDWARLLARKWLLVWNDQEIADSDEALVYQDASPVLRLLGRGFSFGVISALAIVGLVAAWPRRQRVGFLILIVAGIAGSTALFFVFARYRLAMVPALMLLAAAGMQHLVRLLSAPRPRPRVIVAHAVILGAAVLIAWTPVDGHSPPRAMAHYNLAVALESRGELDAAATSYRSALADDPNFIQAHVNLGVILARAGALDESIVHESAALRLRPEDAVAHVNLANALLESGRLEEAEPHYQAALRVAPDQPQAHEGMALLAQLRSGGTR